MAPYATVERVADAAAHAVRRSHTQAFPRRHGSDQPEAGLLMWVRLPGEQSTDTLFESALSEGIRICPGSIFSNTNKFGDCPRLSYGMPFDARIESALKTLARLACEA